MKFIVPAKTNSTRVKDKNWREFARGKSLTEICVEKLLPLGDVVVTCEDESKREMVESWGCGFHLRPVEWTHNDYPLTDWIRNTTAAIAPGETVGWCQVTSPLFDEYDEAIWHFRNRPKNGRDSLVVVYEHRQYYLNSEYQPIGWNFGPWHVTGQRLPPLFQMPWVFSILTPEAIEATGYHIGACPDWYRTLPRPDIDTNDDWEYAKFLYEKRCGVAELEDAGG